jgi:serine/threonine protein kinase
MSRVCSEYVIDRHLGKGGQGNVDLVRDLKGAKYALKTMRSPIEIDGIPQAHLTDIWVSTCFQHPNIAHGYLASRSCNGLNVKEDKGDRDLTTMRLLSPVAQSDLKEWLMILWRHPMTKELLLVPNRLGNNTYNHIKHQLIFFANDIIAGLAQLHLNTIANGDLKPENVLVYTDITAHPYLRARLTDFGAIMSAMTESDPQFQGTMAYASPEVDCAGPPLAQSTGRRRYSDPLAIDMWALGLLLLELFFGINTEFDSRNLLKHIIKLRGLPDASWIHQYDHSKGQECTKTYLTEMAAAAPKRLQDTVLDMDRINALVPVLYTPAEFDSIIRIIDQCLQWNPEKRLNATSLINDPFFTSRRRRINDDISDSIHFLDNSETRYEFKLTPLHMLSAMTPFGYTEIGEWTRRYAAEIYEEWKKTLSEKNWLALAKPQQHQHLLHCQLACLLLSGKFVSDPVASHVPSLVSCAMKHDKVLLQKKFDLGACYRAICDWEARIFDIVSSALPRIAHGHIV